MTSAEAPLLATLLELQPNADPDALRQLFERIGVQRLNHFAWEIRKICPSLSDRELVRLIKLFAHLEEARPWRFCGGSTTQIPTLLAELATRDASLAQEITIWAFHTTTNEYVTFGTTNRCRGRATTVKEYQELNASRFARIHLQEDERRACAEERKAARARAHNERIQAHAEANGKRATYLEGLLELTPLARLEEIACAAFPPDFFPTEFADLHAARMLTPELRGRLLSRLAYAPRGPWGRLRRALTTETDEHD